MFFRLLIFSILAIVVYRVVKSLIGGAGQERVRSGHTPPGQVDDVMVKDPVCGIYFPKRDGVTVDTSQEMIYFCSNKCRDDYLAKQSTRS